MAELSLLLACFGVAGCATTGSPESPPANDNMDAVLWLQSSTEYAAIAAGVYAAATTALSQTASAAAGETQTMAVVMDIDETVLDNFLYQGQLVLDDASYGSESWDRWIALRAAPAIPGAVEFIRTSQSLGVHVAFVTNRPCRPRQDSTEDCPQKLDTLANLEQIGVDTSSTTLLLRGERPTEQCRPLLSSAEQEAGTWSSDKTSRRQCVSLDHDIVMLFGDQLGDFTEVDNAEPGRDLAAEFDDYWGKTWFMLPNPSYGGWRPRDPEEKRGRIRGID